MKPTTLQQKAAALLQLDSRRKAHHYALSKLHASPIAGYDGYDETEMHEKRGLAMWRKLKRLESEARQVTLALCNGPLPEDFRAYEKKVYAEVSKIFGGKLPTGFLFATDGRGEALRLDSDETTILDAIPRNMGGDGILAADISL